MFNVALVCLSAADMKKHDVYLPISILAVNMKLPATAV